MLKNKITLLFFISFLIIGSIIFRDYGLSYDERSNLKNGFMSLKHISEFFEADIKINHAKIFKRIPEFESDNVKARVYGPAFEIILASAGELLKIEDSRNLFLMRHYLTFLLFWTSVIFFYLTIKSVFKDKWLGILGCLFLILSPRIFAHSFYNSKDLAFMSFCIFGIYTQIKFIDNKNYLNAILHALCCGLLIDIRIVGIYIPCLTLFSYYADALITKEINFKKLIYIPTTYIFFLILFIYFFWPYSWEDPINNFISSYNTMKQYPWVGEILYWGHKINTKEIPWHYLPSWILITTPILYSILFFVGLITNIRNISLNPSTLIKYDREKYVLLFSLLFFTPLIAVILLNTIIYNGWRHLYFIYPPFILIAIAGFHNLLNYQFSNSFKQKTLPRLIIILLTTLSLLNTFTQMIRYHPHQNVYFNFLAGDKVLGKFDMDYWGLSYKQLHEYILTINDNEKMNVAVTHYPGKLNYLILDAQSRKRINLIGIKKNYAEADYVLTTYRYKKYVLWAEKNKYPFKNEIYSIYLDNKKIASVFQPNNIVK